MSVRSEPFLRAVRPARRTVPLGVWLDRQSVFGWLMMAPPLLFLAALVGYPFCYGILLSLQDRPVAHPGTFVGLKNFATNFNDPIFWRVVLNTVGTMNGSSSNARTRFFSGNCWFIASAKARPPTIFSKVATAV